MTTFLPPEEHDMEDDQTTANPHTFTISEEFPSNDLEVACEAEGCGWRIEFTGRITDAMRRQAGRLTAEHATVNDLSAKVHAFIHARREFVAVLRQYSTEDMGDYMKWTGHAEARRELAETLGLELDSNSGGLAERTPAAPDARPVMVYGASDDLIEVRGAVDDELGALHDTPTTVAVKTASGQTVWLCAEHDPDGSGEWRVYPVSGHGRTLRDGHELVTIVPARGEDEGDDEDGCPGYSDKAIVRGGFAVQIEAGVAR